MKNFIAVSFLILLLCGCKDKKMLISKNASFDIEKDLSYGESAEQKMDLYIPQNRDSIKGTFVMIHGGGWRGGDKSELSSFVLLMMKAFPDYIFANINYRLANNHTFILPSQTEDIDDALDLLVKKHTEMKLSSDFVLFGNSAGAHLSLLYSYNRLWDSRHRTKVKAVVNVVGPSDLSDPNFRNYSDYDFVEKHMIDLSEPTPTDITNKDIANPVFWINETSAPTLSFYGNNDHVIPLSQKKILDSVLSKHNVYHQSFEFSGGHLDWRNEKNAPFIIRSIESSKCILSKNKKLACFLKTQACFLKKIVCF